MTSNQKKRHFNSTTTISCIGLLLLIAPLRATTKKKHILSIVGSHYREIEHLSEKSLEKIPLETSSAERTKSDPNYMDLYQKYLVDGIKRSVATLPSRGRSIASIGDSMQTEEVKPEGKPRFPVAQSLGIIAFKRGELPSICNQVVTMAKKYSIESVAFFYPVHYSGGNGEKYRMPKNAIYGKHWFYEKIMRFSEKEFDDCLNLVSQAKLKLNFVPHLESLTTMMEENSDKEWRLKSGIPIEENYFHNSFEQIFNYLKKNPHAFMQQDQLKITVLAELDPAIFNSTKKINQGIDFIRERLSSFSINSVGIYLNTNGDFYHVDDLIIRENINCGEVESLFSKINGLSPSMYGDKGHLLLDEKSKKIDLHKTIVKYKEKLIDKVLQYCPNLYTLKKEIYLKKIGLGEFAIDSNAPNQNYIDALKGSESYLDFITYWTNGSWDHLGVFNQSHQNRIGEIILLNKHN